MAVMNDYHRCLCLDVKKCGMSMLSAFKHPTFQVFHDEERYAHGNQLVMGVLPGIRNNGGWYIINRPYACQRWDYESFN